MNAFRDTVMGPSTDAETLEAYRVSVEMRLQNYQSWLFRQVGAFAKSNDSAGSDLMARRALQELRIKFPEAK